MSRVALTQDREKHYKEEVEALEMQMLEKTGFEFEIELPYKHIRSFCEKHVPFATRETLSQIAFRFCNDSFKLPVCLYFHPKVIAAACLQMAVKFRLKSGIDKGMPLEIQGFPWFKWVDSAIE